MYPSMRFVYVTAGDIRVLTVIPSSLRSWYGTDLIGGVDDR